MKRTASFQQFQKTKQPFAVKNFIAVCIIIIASLGMVASLITLLRGKSKPNELAVGPYAAIQEKVNVKLVRTAPMNGARIKDLLALRKSVVNENRSLLMRDYVPYAPVFERAGDGLPWISLKKYYFLGASPGPNDGPSLESKTLLNPFLLAGPEIWGLGVWTKDRIQWNTSLATEEALNRPDFPLYCKPSLLEWYPHEKRARAVYPLQSFINEINRYITNPVSDSQLKFGVVAYNALDFGYRFITVNTPKTRNLFYPHARGSFITITDHLTRKDKFCPEPGPCNGMSPPMRELQHIIIQTLPARLHLEFWKNMPAVKEQEPDFFYEISFE